MAEYDLLTSEGYRHYIEQGWLLNDVGGAKHSQWYMFLNSPDGCDPRNFPDWLRQYKSGKAGFVTRQEFTAHVESEDLRLTALEQDRKAVWNTLDYVQLDLRDQRDTTDDLQAQSNLLYAAISWLAHLVSPQEKTVPGNYRVDNSPGLPAGGSYDLEDDGS